MFRLLKPSFLAHALFVDRYPLVEISRPLIDDRPIQGFLLDTNSRLSLIQQFEVAAGCCLNGYVVIRNVDVKRVRAIANTSFAVKVTKLRGLQPENPKGMTIVSMCDAVQFAGERFPVVKFREERADFVNIYRGRVQSTSRSHVTLQHLSNEGVWGHSKKHLFAEITHVKFGGIFEALLAEIAHSDTCVQS